jgi:uncharacterized Zn-finger protein
MQKNPRTKPVAPQEVIITDTPQLNCDGGKGALGHPRVFLTVNKDGYVDCPYCGKHFKFAAGQLAKGASSSAAH